MPNAASLTISPSWKRQNVIIIWCSFIPYNNVYSLEVYRIHRVGLFWFYLPLASYFRCTAPHYYLLPHVNLIPIRGLGWCFQTPLAFRYRLRRKNKNKGRCILYKDIGHVIQMGSLVSGSYRSLCSGVKVSCRNLWKMAQFIVENWSMIMYPRETARDSWK